MTDRTRAMLPAARLLGPAALLFMLSRYVRHAADSYPSFDGAMNLNVARSLAEGHGYGFRYDGFFAFPAQTDGPFILPAALVFRLFGIGLFTAQLTSLVYLLGFASLVVLLLRQLGASLWLASATAALCLLTPGVGTYGMDGYGEIPMLAWMLAGLLAGLRALETGRHRPALLFASGTLLGLSVLTKTIAVLCVAPVGLCLAVAMLVRHRGRSGVGGVACLVAGCVVPVVAWEVFRLVSLGSGAGWIRWWRLQLEQVALQSGSHGGFSLPVLTGRVRVHFAGLVGQTGVPGLLLPVWLLLPWGAAFATVASRRRMPGIRLGVGVLGLGSLLYFVWWLAVTPNEMVWLRRIMPGLVLQTCLIAVLLSVLLDRPPTRGGIRLGAASLAVLVASAELPLLVAGMGQSPPVSWPFRRQETGRIVAMLRALPADSVIFGVGWWQAPELSLFADRSFMNFDLWSAERINASSHVYFVVDGAATYISPDRIRDVLLHTRTVTLTKGREVALYRILSADPDLALNDPSPPPSRFDAGTDTMAHGSGWYPSMWGSAWVRPESRIRLLRSDESRLVIEAAFDPALFPAADSVRHLHVALPGCLDRTLALTAPGWQTIALPLRCPAASPPGPVTVTLSLDGRMPSAHQLDSDTRLRGFKIRTLSLEH